MARCTITITDKPGGGVECVADPSYAALMRIAREGQLTSAHGCMFTALRAVLNECQKQDRTKLLTPQEFEGSSH